MRRWGRVVGASVVAAALAFGCTAITGVGDLVEVACTSDCIGPPPVDGSFDHPLGMDAARDVLPVPDATHRDVSVPPPLCVDASFASDPDNCGACGHSCLGGACSLGTCQPVALAGVLLGVNALTLDTENVYFSDIQSGTVYRMTKNGASLTALVTVAEEPVQLAVDATNLYYADQGTGSIVRCALASPACSPGSVIAPAPMAEGLAIDSEYFYWTADTDAGGTILQAAKPGGSGSATLASPAAKPHQVTVDSAYVYWTASPGGHGGGEVSRAPLPGMFVGSPTNYATGLSDPIGLAVNTTTIFWANHGGGTVMSCPLGGCAPSGPTVVAGQGVTSPNAIALDPSYFYFTDTAGTVDRCPLAGCTGVVTVMASGGSPLQIAVDTEAVYWTDSERGAVFKVAK
jgi:sugar lactone lactonase YvrE